MTDKPAVLITGGAGFIGSHLAEKLLSVGYRVIVFDNFQTGSLANLAACQKNPDFTLITGDVNNWHDLRPLLQVPVDYIYHYAACVGVDRTLTKRLDVLDDIEGIKNILNLAREKKVTRFFYSSSSEVYGESVSYPQNENSTPINSRLPYAAVKNLGEIYIRAYHLEYGLNYTVFRFFNTYGPRQSPDFVISKFINQALKNADITVYGDGSQSRSFMYIADNITATVAPLTNQKAVNTIINIGNPLEVPVSKLAALVIKVAGSKSRIVHLPPLKEGDMLRRVPDISLMQSLLGVTPQISLESGLTDTVAYMARGL